MKYLLTLVGFFLINTTQAQNGKEIIDNICGCFQVEFRYAETFSHQSGYKFQDREFIDGGVELSLPIEVSDNKIVIQHLLVINDTVIIKHWREEWVYESPELWVYKGDRLWVKEKVAPADAKGKWTQTVWEVSDEPRYQGYSQFVNLDNKIIWQSTTDAPLPRREYTNREDYNVLKRTNRLVIGKDGYVHEQDNYKIQRTAGVDKILVEERGLNTYKRLPEADCSSALNYWNNNKPYWDVVRKVWKSYLENNNTIQLKFKVEEKLLHDYLYKLSYVFAKKKMSTEEVEGMIKDEINKFIIPAKNVAGVK